MKRKNEGKKWNKEEVLEFWNTPKTEYKQLAEKFGRSEKAIEVLHRTKEEISKISSFIKPNSFNPDKYMLEFFIEGKKPNI